MRARSASRILLYHYLLGGLRRNAAELLGENFDLDFISKLVLGVNGFCLRQGLSPPRRPFFSLDHSLIGKNPEVAGFRVQLPPDPLPPLLVFFFL